MIPRSEVPEELSRLAARQAGAVGRQQVVGLGMSDKVIGRLIRSGQWRRLAQGVYATSPETWLQQVWGGVLVAGDTAVVGRHAAAKLWNIPLDLPTRASSVVSQRGDNGYPIDIFIGQGHRTPEARGPWRFIRADRDGQSSPPRTSLAQTIIDLAETMTGDQMASLIGRNLRRVRPSALQAILNQTIRYRQRRLLTEVLSDSSAGVSSALERRYIHDVERPHGLPLAQRQAKPVGIYTVDNLYQDFDVIVELDSQAYHRGVAASQDLSRDRTHTHHGFTTLRFTWSDVVDHPCRTAADIATALTRRGWKDHLIRCKRCP